MKLNPGAGLTYAQKAKAVAAQVAALATAVAAGLAYVATLELGDTAKGWAVAAAAAVTVVGSVASRIAVFQIPNSPTLDEPFEAPSIDIEGSH